MIHLNKLTLPSTASMKSVALVSLKIYASGALLGTIIDTVAYMLNKKPYFNTLATDMDNLTDDVPVYKLTFNDVVFYGVTLCAWPYTVGKNICKKIAGQFPEKYAPHPSRVISSPLDLTTDTTSIAETTTGTTTGTTTETTPVNETTGEQ